MSEPTLIPGAAWMIFMFCHLPASLLSSSAGNLYRTQILKENPFPYEFGHAGDSVWSLKMSLSCRWVIDPKVESYFWEHPEADHKEHFNGPVVEKIRTASQEIFDQHMERLLEAGVPAELLHEAKESYLTCTQLTLIKREYRAMKKPFIPWFLQPKAASLRRQKKVIIAEKRHRLAMLADYAKQIVQHPESTSGQR